MKKRMVKRFFSVLATAVLMASFSINVAAQSDAGAFAGFNVNVYDSTTVATFAGSPNRHFTVFNFKAADGRALGSICGSAYFSIMERQGLSDGGRYWFADEFNRFRGLTGTVGQAVADVHGERIEEFRSELVRLVNLERQRHGLHPYVVDEDLMRFSQVRAQELDVLFSHTRPNGLNAGYEIISMGRGTPQAVVESWMNSPGHRAAILNNRRTNVGAGVYVNRAGGLHWQMYFYGDDLSRLRDAGFDVP